MHAGLTYTINRKNRIRETTHKCGTQAPRNTVEGNTLDRDHTNRFCRETIDKEIKELGVAMNMLENVQLDPKGC